MLRRRWFLIIALPDAYNAQYAYGRHHTHALPHKHAKQMRFEDGARSSARSHRLCNRASVTSRCGAKVLITT
jgi:hypothetical protein